LICKSCGAFLSDDLTECPVCGTVVSDDAANNESNSEDRSMDDVVESQVQKSVTEDTTVDSNDSNEDDDDSAPLTNEEIEAILEKEAGDEFDIKEESSDTSSNDNTSNMRADGIYIDQMEDAPVSQKKKLGSSGIIAIVLAVLLVFAAAFCVILIAGKNEESPLNGVYTSITDFFGKVFSDNKVKEYGAKDVVATLGDHKLTNAELSLYYYDNAYFYYVYLYTYTGAAPFDINTSLFEQEYTDSQSWGDMIVAASIDSWKVTKVVSDIVKNERFTLPEDRQAEIDSIKTNIESTAKSQGYSSGEEYIQAQYGSFATVDDYIKYYTESVYYECYSQSIYEPKYRDYLDDNIDTLDSYNVSVRHILISPEVENDEDSLLEAKLKAENIYKEWLDGGAKEDQFIELVTTHSADTASIPNGGLYEDFAEGSMVKSFEDWSFDSSRKYGDSGIVESEYGYHIMFFITRTNPEASIKAQDEVNMLFDGALSEYDFNQFLDKINIKTIRMS